MTITIFYGILCNLKKIFLIFLFLLQYFLKTFIIDNKILYI